MLVCLQNPRSETDAAAENNKETCASDIFLRRVKIHKEAKGVLIEIYFVSITAAN